MKITHTLQALAVATLVTAAISGCKSSGSGSVSLVGAGSTFVYPVMTRWTADFEAKNTNVQINYQSIGSGGGIQQVKAGTVDFGASDAPLNDAALAAMAPMVQIPRALARSRSSTTCPR